LTAAESNGEGALDATMKSGDEGDGSRGGAGVVMFEKFQLYGPAEYIYPTAVSGSEWNNSVAPICVIASSIAHR
jgi:hypothetical protein